MRNDYITQQKQLIREIKNLSFKNNIKATVVTMQKDYENDDRICLTLNTFIPESISQKIIENIIMPLKKIEPNQFYYSPELMHLTIKTIRIINKPPTFTDKDVIKVDRLFKELIPKFPPFTFRLEDLVLFPTSVSLIGYCDERFKKLVQTLDLGLKKIGVPDDKKYFSNKVFFSHITVCRFTHKPTTAFVKKIEELKNIKIGELKVAKLSLVTCNAVCSLKTRKTISTYQLKK